jgi:hypothetical protein
VSKRKARVFSLGSRRRFRKSFGLLTAHPHPSLPPGRGKELILLPPGRGTYS